MTHDEMRACRREWINHYLCLGAKKASEIKTWVRLAELANWSFELKAYGSQS